MVRRRLGRSRRNYFLKAEFADGVRAGEGVAAVVAAFFVGEPALVDVEQLPEDVFAGVDGVDLVAVAADPDRPGFVDFGDGEFFGVLAAVTGQHEVGEPVPAELECDGSPRAGR